MPRRGAAQTTAWPQLLLHGCLTAWYLPFHVLVPQGAEIRWFPVIRTRRHILVDHGEKIDND
jgi:hypothetical protein